MWLLPFLLDAALSHDGSCQHDGNQRVDAFTLFPQISSDLLKPPSLKPPFAAEGLNMLSHQARNARNSGIFVNHYVEFLGFLWATRLKMLEFPEVLWITLLKMLEF